MVLLVFVHLITLSYFDWFGTISSSGSFNFVSGSWWCRYIDSPLLNRKSSLDHSFLSSSCDSTSSSCPRTISTIDTDLQRLWRFRVWHARLRLLILTSVHDLLRKLPDHHPINARTLKHRPTIFYSAFSFQTFQRYCSSDSSLCTGTIAVPSFTLQTAFTATPLVSWRWVELVWFRCGSWHVFLHLNLLVYIMCKLCPARVKGKNECLWKRHCFRDVVRFHRIDRNLLGEVVLHGQSILALLSSHLEGAMSSVLLRLRLASCLVSSRLWFFSWKLYHQQLSHHESGRSHLFLDLLLLDLKWMMPSLLSSLSSVEYLHPYRILPRDISVLRSIFLGIILRFAKMHRLLPFLLWMDLAVPT